MLDCMLAGELDIKRPASADIALPAVMEPVSLREALVEASAYPHVRVARCYTELEAIGKIRHSQYVQRQRKSYVSISTDGEALVELPDLFGINIYARSATGITAALRVGNVDDASHPAFPLFMETVERFGLDTSRTVVCTRLVTHPSYKGGHAADLVRFVRYQTVSAAFRYCIAQVAPHLLGYFRRFEFYPTGTVVDDTAAGPLHLVVLDTKMRTRIGDKALCA